MNRIVLIAAIGLLFTTTAFAQTVSTPLIVVGDMCGLSCLSALPYYRALNLLEAQKVVSPVPRPALQIRNPSDAEAAMLPVRSELLSPGEEAPRALHAPGLKPVFLVGDDERSFVWLRQRAAVLRDLRAVGLVVNVSSPAALAELRRLVPELTLLPVSADDLAQRLGLRHYPVLMTATGIEP